MPDIRTSSKFVRNVALAALALALTACADPVDAGENEEGETLELGIRVEAAPGTKLLARTRFSASHRVEFWQGANNAVSLIEDYVPDLGERSALDGFRGDSFAALYEKLAGKNVDAAVLARLRAVDARPRKRRIAEPNVTAPKPVTQSGPEAHPITKTVSEDSKWFLEQICNPRSAKIDPDLDLCWTNPIEPGYKEVLWGATGFYLFQGSLFNAASSGTAKLIVTPEDPKHGKTITAGPRAVVNVALADDDDAFAIQGKGDSFAIYYSFID